MPRCLILVCAGYVSWLLVQSVGDRTNRAGIRLGLPGRWPLAASHPATKREGARLEGNPGFRVAKKPLKGLLKILGDNQALARL